MIQLRPIGCHPNRALIDADGHFLTELKEFAGQQNRRSECRPRRREESTGGAAGQRCTEGIGSARGPIPSVFHTELLTGLECKGV